MMYKEYYIRGFITHRSDYTNGRITQWSDYTMVGLHNLCVFRVSVLHTLYSVFMS
jgi:hypothetical protein